MAPSTDKRRATPLPPPLFSNQRSNLSALASSMASFSADTLNAAKHDQQDIKHHIKEAALFLNEQRNRITRIEQHLLDATRDILPFESKCMTLAELLQSCVSLQQANVEFMKRLDEKMCREYAGYSSVLTNNPKCLVSQQQQQEPTCRVLVEMATPSWQPLEQVVETDNETDATTTPGSSAFLSPPLSATSQPQQGGTPVTPSLDHLQLSSNTTAVLHQEASLEKQENSQFGANDFTSLASKRHSLDAIEAWRAHRYSTGTTVEELPELNNEADHVPKTAMKTKEPPPADEAILKDQSEKVESTLVSDQEHDCCDSNSLTSVSDSRLGDLTIVGATDFTFCDDDTAVATVATKIGRGRQHTQAISNILKQGQPQVSFATDSSENDETFHKSTSPADSPTSTQRSPQSKSPSFTQANVTIMGCNETMMDDETVTNADMTVLGHGRQKKTNSQGSTIAALSNERVERKQTGNENETFTSTSPGEHTVKEIIVNTSASSSRSGNHQDTASDDVSVLDSSTIASARSFVKETEDETNTTLGSLLVTPVLDRYRLEADDTSIGVKVVPNQRGGHHGVAKQKNLLTKYGAPPPKPTSLQAIKPVLKSTPVTNEQDLPSTSMFVTQRTKTVFRKTPHPKKAGVRHALADENASPNQNVTSTPLHARRLDSETTSKGETLRSPFLRVSLPELTQRPYRSSLPSTARRLPFSATKVQPERRHTISFNKEKISSTRSPLTAAFIAKHMLDQRDTSLVDSLDVSGDSSFSFVSSS